MKVKIEFDDEEEARVHLNARKYQSILFDFHQFLRTVRKHTDLDQFKNKEELLYYINDKFYEIVNDEEDELL